MCFLKKQNHEKGIVAFSYYKTNIVPLEKKHKKEKILLKISQPRDHYKYTFKSVYVSARTHKHSFSIDVFTKMKLYTNHYFVSFSHLILQLAFHATKINYSIILIPV